MKPFRLISDTELNCLRERLAVSLQAWNTQYALYPLSCTLKPAIKPDTIYPILSDIEPLVLPHQDDWSVLQYALLGVDDDCFNNIAETLGLTCLQVLLGTETLHHQTETQCDAWFYTGSPALTLILSCEQRTMMFTLHPQWVSNALPYRESIQAPMSTLQQALVPQTFVFNVMLDPLALTLQDILQLQIGDVIKTETHISLPLRLQQNQQILAHVNLGEIQQTSAIQIVRPS